MNFAHARAEARIRRRAPSCLAQDGADARGRVATRRRARAPPWPPPAPRHRRLGGEFGGAFGEFQSPAALARAASASRTFLAAARPAPPAAPPPSSRSRPSSRDYSRAAFLSSSSGFSAPGGFLRGAIDSTAAGRRRLHARGRARTVSAGFARSTTRAVSRGDGSSGAFFGAPPDVVAVASVRARLFVRARRGVLVAGRRRLPRGYPGEEAGTTPGRPAAMEDAEAVRRKNRASRIPRTTSATRSSRRSRSERRAPRCGAAPRRRPRSRSPARASRSGFVRARVRALEFHDSSAARPRGDGQASARETPAARGRLARRSEMVARA